MQYPQGSAGNTDVGLSLAPFGLLANMVGAMGARITIVSTNPTITGTAGDVRLADGTIVSWTTVAAGIIDSCGNELFAAGTAPFTVNVASASIAVALGAVGSAGITSATPTRWITVTINGTKYAQPLWPTT